MYFTYFITKDRTIIKHLAYLLIITKVKSNAMPKMPNIPFFRPKKLPLIGIDISSSAVKILETHPSGQQLKVASYGITSLENGAVADRRIKDYKSVARSIKRVINLTQPNTRRAAVAIPNAAIITRTLSLPRELNDEETEALVRVEADQHIPYPLNEVAIDFQRLPPLNSNDENQPVLVVACRKEVTDQLDYVLEVAGLEPVITDVENFAMQRSLGLILKNLSQQEQSLVAVADIGATTTTLNLLKNGEIIYSRDQAFGGKQLTDEIQRLYGLSLEEAAFAKKKGNLPTSYYSDLLKPFKVALIQQIERQLQLFYSSTSYHNIDHLILAGGSAAIPNLTTISEQQLDCPTHLANPFIGMALSSKVDINALTQDAPAMMIACGLAMRAKP